MRNIFLIGPMGAGKTTIGRKLASQLGLEFYDSDREIESQCGVSIPTIFDYEGESGFRDREVRMIEQLTAQQGIVLATGGGAVLRAENRRHLGSRGHVIYLQVSIEEQLERTSRNKNRPLLNTENPRERLEGLIAERGPLYEELADFSICSKAHNMRPLIRKICAFIQQRDHSSAEE